MKKLLYPVRNISILVAMLLTVVAVYPQQAIFTSNGSSGAATISGPQIINSYYPVSHISGNQITCNGFHPSVGDRVLIIAMTGPAAGAWQWDSVRVAGSPFTVSGLYRSFGNGKVQVVTVPQYTSLHITAGGMLTAAPWNDSTGGILTFLVQDTFSIDSGGICNVNGLGFTPLTGTGSFGTGGAGGAGGTAGGLDQNGGDSLFIAGSGTSGGGNGGFYGLAGMGGDTAAGLLNDSLCPDCSGDMPASSLNPNGDSATNTSNLIGGISNSTFILGGAGKGGSGGAGGSGGGGGGGGDATPGTAGSAGGAGGSGGIGGSGGGLILFASGYLNVPLYDTVFSATGMPGGSGQAGTAGGSGGNGGNGNTSCNTGGGGVGANGGNGGDGGDGGGGGFVYAVLFNTSLTFSNTSMQTNGGSGGIGGLGGPGGPGGTNGTYNGTGCSGTGGTGTGANSAPSGVSGANGANGAPGTGSNGAGSGGGSGGSGGGGGGGGYIVSNCSTDQIGNNFPGVVINFGCPTDGYDSYIESFTYGGDSSFAFTDMSSTDAYGTSYDITAIDGRGCSATFIYSISAPLQLTLIPDQTVTPSCAGVGNGTLNLYLEEGATCINIATFDSVYNSSGALIGTNTLLTGLSPDTYTIAYGFVDSPSSYTTVVIPEDTPVIVSATLTQPTCPNPYGGDILITDSGGISCDLGLGTFIWYDNNGNIITYGLEASGLAAGTYTLIFNYNGSSFCGPSLISNPSCPQTWTYILTNPVGPSDTTISDTICAGLSYQNVNSVYYSSGYYSDTIYGGSVTGCDSIINLNLTVLDPITTPNGVSPQYDGDNCGVPFDVFYNAVSGGDGNYNYSVSAYPPGSCIPTGGLDIPYSVLITDGHGCTGQYNTDVIYVDDEFDFLPLNSTNTSCANSSDGTYTGYVVDYTNQECNYTWNLTIQGTTTTYSYTTAGSTTGGSINITGLSADNYIYSISGSDQCSPITTGYFTIYSNTNPIYGNEFDTICSGASLTWNGSPYSQTGSYLYVIPGGSVTGCDSNDYLTLTVLQPLDTVLYDTIATGGSVQVGSNTYSQTGVYVQTLSGIYGCDSTVTLNLTVSNSSPSNTTLYEAICQGASFTVGSAHYSAGGVYNDTLTGVTGDSIVTLYLTVYPLSSTVLFDTICDGSLVIVGSSAYTQSGVYTNILTDMHGCDSTVTLNLLVYPTLFVSLYDSICQGSSIYVGFQNYSQSGTYTNVFTSVTGCDSVVKLYLTVYPLATTVINQNICPNSSYTIAGQTFTQTGNYNITLTDMHGCDSLLVLNLTVSATVSTSLYDTICQGSSVSVGSQNYTQSGTYTNTLTSINGCDSTVTLNLTVNPTSSINIYDTICQGSSVNIGGQSYSQPGTYAKTLTGVNGCDSVVNLSLAVYPNVTVDQYDTLSIGNALHIGAQSFYTSGVYYVTLNTVHGCDSAITIYLLVDTPATFAHLFDTICQGLSVTVSGHTYSVSGTYIDTLTGTLGGDSIVTLDLTVNAVINNIYDTISNGMWVLFGANTYTQPGIYIDTTVNSSGCEDISVLHLFVVTGINELSFISGVTIYPNPTQGSFTMEIDAPSISTKSAEISVINMMGQEVMGVPVTLQAGNNKELIPLSEGTSAGVYVVQLTVDGQSLYYRLVLDK